MTKVGVMFRNNLELVYPFFYFLHKSMRLKRYDLIVVDDASEDGTWLEIKRCLDVFPLNGHYHRNMTQKGISVNRNYIAKTADSDIILIDSDIFLMHRNALTFIEEHAEKNQLDVCYGANRNHWDWDVVKQDGMCFAFIKKETFEKIGYFDEQFFNYYDDCDFHTRIIQSKLKYGCCNKAQAVHLWGETCEWGSEGGEKRNKILEDDKRKYEIKWGIRNE